MELRLFAVRADQLDRSVVLRANETGQLAAVAQRDVVSDVIRIDGCVRLFDVAEDRSGIARNQIAQIRADGSAFAANPMAGRALQWVAEEQASAVFVVAAGQTELFFDENRGGPIRRSPGIEKVGKTQRARRGVSRHCVRKG